MNTDQKNTIKMLLVDFCERVGSQNKAGKILTGVSVTNINHVINDKWASISDEMWRNIGSQIGYGNDALHVGETSNFKTITEVIADAQYHHKFRIVVGRAGLGKTVANEWYRDNNKNVYLLTCSNLWSLKYFLEQLLRTMGEPFEGMNKMDMVNAIVAKLNRTNSPVIILDQANSVNDSILYFLITLVNETLRRSGLVMTGTPELWTRIDKGIKKGKLGYEEVYSRAGDTVIRLKETKLEDVEIVCALQNITDTNAVHEIFSTCNGSLRVADYKIHKHKLKGAAPAKSTAA